MTILTPLQKSFLTSFFDFPFGKDFFLSGGTALSEFYIKHRLSQDIDIFTTNQEIDFEQVTMGIRQIAYELNLKTTSESVSKTFLKYFFKKTNQTLKVDIIKDIPIHFGKIRKFGDIRVDSIENI